MGIEVCLASLSFTESLPKTKDTFVFDQLKVPSDLCPLEALVGLSKSKSTYKSLLEIYKISNLKKNNVDFYWMIWP